MTKLEWLTRHPIALMNVAFILLIGSLFFYQLMRPLDVLEDWTIQLAPVNEYRVIDGRRLAVYHPNESLIFTSSSRKVSNAQGSISRSLVCEPTTELDEREILLDVIPANRDLGVSPERASSIILPDVTQFNRLPRICKLVVDITYTNVALWRNHTEHAETEPFIVEELQLSPQEAREEIERLNELISELRGRLEGSPENVSGNNLEARQPEEARPQPAQPQRSSRVSATAPVNPPTPTEPTQPEQPEQRVGLIEGVTDGLRSVVNGILGR